jgi:hypothetical protein
MFGHGVPPGAGAGVVDFVIGGVGVGVELVVGVACVLVPFVEVVLCAVVAAPALAMPAAAPPLASAPATIVAPSSLEMDMRSNLLGSTGRCAPIVRDAAKS